MNDTRSAAGPESESESEGEGEGEGETLTNLLDRINREDMGLAAEMLASELDELLGRVTPNTEALPPRSIAPKRRRGKSFEFEWYSRIVEGLPLLDAERTTAAARSIEVGLLAEERLLESDGTDIDRHAAAELHTLVRHGREEFDLLIVSNLRLVFHWSKGVASSIDTDWAQDAFQAGCIGLIRGLQGWDHTKGYALSTFVSWHIRQSIQRWRANEVLLVRLPVHVWERLDSPDSLTAEVRAAADRAQNILSIDAMTDDTPDLAWDGGLAREALRFERTAFVNALLSTLPEREANVLELRFGISPPGIEPQTLDSIGMQLGVTRERIRQLEKKALDKLRGYAGASTNWSYLA